MGITTCCFLVTFAYSRSLETSAAWFSSCLTWLRGIAPHIYSFGIQLEHFDQLVDRDNRIFLQYRGCLFFVALAEINKVLKKHQSYPYTPLLQECRNTCSKLLSKITTATENIVLPDDMKLMTLFFQASGVLFAPCVRNFPV